MIHDSFHIPYTFKLNIMKSNCNTNDAVDICRHIIGKDIIWFHCVIWPCILMSAGVTLPAGVFSHGFVNAADGRKMSKSYNNAIDPHEVL